MPIFIVLCLITAFLVESSSPLQKTLSNPVFVYLGLGIALFAVAGNFLKKIPEIWSYDIFASGTLLAWFALWKPLFIKDSPIFFFFPVYFALMAALATLLFISQRHKIDQPNLNLMRTIADTGFADSWLVMVLALITLYFENHFLQFPVMMTLLTTRFTLSGCLLPVDRDK